MQAVLVMFRSDGERRSFSVTRDMTVVGRREDCDLRIPLHEVSRKHARLVRDGDTLRLEDLGSSNGTYLNGQRVQEAVLNPGDSVQIGPVVFVLQVDGYPTDEELNPVAADQTSHDPTAPTTNMGPLSPTAQSEYGDVGHLEPLPLEEDIGLADLEPLPLEDHMGLGESSEYSEKSEADLLNSEPAEHENIAEVNLHEPLAAHDVTAHAEPAPTEHDTGRFDVGMLESTEQAETPEHLPMEKSAAQDESEPQPAVNVVSPFHVESPTVAEHEEPLTMDHASEVEQIPALEPELSSAENHAIPLNLEPLPSAEIIGDAHIDPPVLPFSQGDEATLDPLTMKEIVSFSKVEPTSAVEDLAHDEFELLPGEESGLEMDLELSDEISEHPNSLLSSLASPAPASEKVNGSKPDSQSSAKSDLADLDDDFLTLMPETPKQARGNEPLGLDLDLDLDLDPPHRPHV